MLPVGYRVQVDPRQPSARDPGGRNVAQTAGFVPTAEHSHPSLGPTATPSLPTARHGVLTIQPLSALPPVETTGLGAAEPVGQTNGSNQGSEDTRNSTTSCSKNQQGGETVSCTSTPCSAPNQGVAAMSAPAPARVDVASSACNTGTLSSFDDKYASTRLLGGAQVISQEVFLEVITQPGAGSLEVTQLFSFWRPRVANASRRSSVLSLSNKQLDAMYALAGCADVMFLISRVNMEVRRAIEEAYGVDKYNFATWFKNRGRNPSKTPQGRSGGKRTGEHDDVASPLQPRPGDVAGPILWEQDRATQPVYPTTEKTYSIGSAAPAAEQKPQQHWSHGLQLGMAPPPEEQPQQRQRDMAPTSYGELHQHSGMRSLVLASHAQQGSQHAATLPQKRLQLRMQDDSSPISSQQQSVITSSYPPATHPSQQLQNRRSKELAAAPGDSVRVLGVLQQHNSAPHPSQRQDWSYGVLTQQNQGSGSAAPHAAQHAAPEPVARGSWHISQIPQSANGTSIPSHLPSGSFCTDPVEQPHMPSADKRSKRSHEAVDEADQEAAAAFILSDLKNQRAAPMNDHKAMPADAAVQAAAAAGSGRAGMPAGALQQHHADVPSLPPKNPASSSYFAEWRGAALNVTASAAVPPLPLAARSESVDPNRVTIGLPNGTPVSLTLSDLDMLFDDGSRHSFMLQQPQRSLEQPGADMRLNGTSVTLLQSQPNEQLQQHHAEGPSYLSQQLVKQVPIGVHQNHVLVAPTMCLQQGSQTLVYPPSSSDHNARLGHQASGSGPAGSGQLAASGQMYVVVPQQHWDQQQQQPQQVYIQVPQTVLLPGDSTSVPLEDSLGRYPTLQWATVPNGSLQQQQQLGSLSWVPPTSGSQPVRFSPGSTSTRNAA